MLVVALGCSLSLLIVIVCLGYYVVFGVVVVFSSKFGYIVMFYYKLRKIFYLLYLSLGYVL